MVVKVSREEIVEFAHEIADEFFEWFGDGYGEDAYKSGVRKAVQGLLEKDVKRFLSVFWGLLSWFAEKTIDETQAREIEEQILKQFPDFYLIIADELEKIADRKIEEVEDDEMF